MRKKIETWQMDCDFRGCSQSVIFIDNNQELPGGWVKKSFRHCEDCYYHNDKFFCPEHKDTKDDV